MTIKDIQVIVAQLEGKGKSISMGDAREVVSIISDLVYQDSEVIQLLINNGKRRQKRLE